MKKQLNKRRLLCTDEQPNDEVQVVQIRTNMCERLVGEGSLRSLIVHEDPPEFWYVFRRRRVQELGQVPFIFCISRL